jgi:hypothetical protein
LQQNSSLYASKKLFSLSDECSGAACLKIIQDLERIQNKGRYFYDEF